MGLRIHQSDLGLEKEDLSPLERYQRLVSQARDTDFRRPAKSE